jgi:hypothetical protein
MVNGQKVNIQIAKNGNILTIGYPLILGSFWSVQNKQWQFLKYVKRQ